MPGPDHSSSLNPEQFSELVDGIRNVESALGSTIKSPTEAERRNTYGMRRSMVAQQDLKKGAILSKEHISFKRPLNGLSPKKFYDVFR